MTQPPKFSKTQDNFSHHTSPATGQPQTPLTPIKPKPAARQVTGTIRTPTLPDHVTKHPNPVGRPKLPPQDDSGY